MIVALPKRSFGTNVLINASFPIAPIVVSVASVPVYLSLIGLERYGLLTLVWLVSGTFSLLDLGLGRATNFRVARAFADGGGDAPGTSVADAVLTALVFNLTLGVLAASAFWIFVGPSLFGVVKTHPALGAELLEAMPFIAALLPVTLCTAILRGAAEGRSAFVVANCIQAAGQIGTTLAGLSVAWLAGPALPGIVLAILVVRVVTMLALGLVSLRLISRGRLMGRRETLALLRFGGWDSLFTGLATMLLSADRFIIGWLLGAGAVATYAIPYSVIQRTQFVRGALLRTLFPKLAGTRDPQTRHALAARMLKATMAATAAVSIPVLVLVEDVLALWIDPAFAASAGPVAEALVLAFWIVTLLRTLFVLEVASGRPDVPARLRLVTGVPFLGLLAGMITILGGLGAALSLALWWSLELAFMLMRTRMLREAAVPLAVWSLLWASGMTAALTPLPSLANVLLALLLGTVSAALALVLSPDLKRLVRRPLEKLLRQVPRGVRPRQAGGSREEGMPSPAPSCDR